MKLPRGTSLLSMCALLVAGTAMAMPPDAGTPVSISDLRARGVQGELGVPMGTIVRIDGSVIDGDSLKKKAFAGTLLLRVERVDGKRLDSPVTLAFSSEAKLKAGETFALMAYESGGFVGAPDGMFKYTLPFATTGFHFESRLVVLAPAAKAQ